MQPAPDPASIPDITVVAPVFDEAGAAAELAREIAKAFQGRRYEMIFVDDHSGDATVDVLTALKAELPALRVLTHRANAGQSRAIRTGVLAARGAIIPRRRSCSPLAGGERRGGQSGFSARC